MTVLREGDLQITINDAIEARKFDDEASHGLSHCMKAVDFVVELPDRYLFIEVKDPKTLRLPRRPVMSLFSNSKQESFTKISNTSIGTPFSTSGRQDEPTKNPLITWCWLLWTLWTGHIC